MLTNKIFNASALKYIPSRMLPLGSAGLPSLVATPCNRTTTTCLVVQLFTL